MATRRQALVGLLVSLVGAACAPSEEKSVGVRGQGTVLRTPVPLFDEEELARPTATTAPPQAAEGASVPAPAGAPTAQPTTAPAAAPRSAAPGSTEAQAHVIPGPVGRPPSIQPLPARQLVIPQLGIDSRVVSLGTYVDARGELAWETAPFAVGHHRGTAGPGQPGNMVLSGHISSPGEGAVFKRLPEIREGQGFVVATDERQFLYRVVGIQTVLPTEVSVMEPTEAPTATLITCVPDGIYSHRLVVSAELV